MSTIVVGVDGSEASVEALRFAIEEARLHDAEVKAVNAWHIPVIVYEAGWVPVPLDLSAYPKAAQEMLDKSLEQTGAAESGVKVTTVVKEGSPAAVLLKEARDADLLVVGSRGLGGFRGLMLGSVSQQCAHHAPCPIVILPHSVADKDHEEDAVVTTARSA